jgi:hypothetical protein
MLFVAYLMLLKACFVYSSLLDVAYMSRGCNDLVTLIMGMAMSLLGKSVVLLRVSECVCAARVE